MWLQQNLYPAKPLLTCPYIPHRSHLAWCDAQLVLQLPNSCVADAGDGPVLHLLRLIHLLMQGHRAWRQQGERQSECFISYVCSGAGQHLLRLIHLLMHRRRAGEKV